MCSSAKARVRFSCPGDTVRRAGQAGADPENSRARCGVQQQPQSRKTSHSSSSFAGETMSPRISNVPFIDPIQAARFSVAVGGITSATGLPNRVMRTGFFVAQTSSSTARHFALNSEMAISCTIFLYGHFTILWSIILTMDAAPLDSRGRLSLRERFLCRQEWLLVM
jgi:hypothetical protein